MKVLLDTHAWYWACGVPDRLSRVAVRVITDEEARFYLSAISLWEFLVHIRKRRISVEGDPRVWVARANSLLGVSVLPISEDIAMRSEALEGFPGMDPADRFIVATAVVHDLPILSADRVIQSWSGVKTIW